MSNIELHPIQPVPIELLAAGGNSTPVRRNQHVAMQRCVPASVHIPGGACTAFNYYKSIGLSANAAAGIVGNLIQESQMDPYAGKGSSHQGIAQWSPSRWATLVAYAKKTKQNQWGLWFQITYVYTEMKQSYSSVLKFLRQKGITVDSATSEVFLYYEGPGDSSLPTRTCYAKGVLAQCK
jgi:hypothetical protein